MNVNLRNEQIWLAVGSLMLLGTIGLAVALIYTRPIMIPFVLALFITTLVAPLVDYQVVRCRIPRWIAIPLVLLLVLAVLSLLGMVMIVTGQTIVQAAREYSGRIVELTEEGLAFLKEHKIDVEPRRISAELEARLPQLITDAVGTVTATLSSGFLIMIFVVFLLVGRNSHVRRTGMIADAEATVREYLATKTAISAVTGLLVGTILWALGMPMYWLFGILAFMLNYIPSIGSIIATLLPIPIAVTQYENPWMVLAVVGIPGTVHMTVGNLIEPKLMGRGLELHPVTVLLALAFWGLIWGVVGMVLAVPIVATLRIVLARFSSTRALGELLAGHLPGTLPARRNTATAG